MRPRSAWSAALGLGVVTALLIQPGRRVALEVGHPSGSLLGPGWSASDRTELNEGVAELDPESTWIENRFRFRAGETGASVRLPVAARGDARLSLYAMARVRTAVTIHVNGEPAARLTVPRGPWTRHTVELPVPSGADGLELRLALEAQPMVRVPDAFAKTPIVWVRRLELESPAGLAFAGATRGWLALLPIAVFAVALATGAGRSAALVGGVATAALLIGLARVAAIPLLIAIPRLVPLALAGALATRAALAAARAVSPASRAGLAALVAGGILFHGSLAFVPGYDPGDLEIHVRRARDLGTLTLDYASLLRYGSHLPTPSQTFGEATAALGDAVPIPYSPASYVLYYLLHAAGIDLHWGMTVANTLLAMALTPWLFVVTQRILGVAAAWPAALLYTLDLPIWHHIARSHAPAAFGMALAPAALLLLAHQADALAERRRAVVCGLALGVAVLGYSTLVWLVGLFGLALLALLALDARGLDRGARHGLALALCAGGVLAGGLFYFHYLPGLIAAPGAPETPDLFLGRSYFLFHNESRQSMRVWAAGFALPLAAGLVAAPWALRRASAGAHPILVAWLLSWAGTMLLKEPFLFPRPLRWAKEDQFVAPLLAVLIGGAILALPRAWQRWAAGAIAIGVALWLQVGDFLAHASGVFA